MLVLLAVESGHAQILSPEVQRGLTWLQAQVQADGTLRGEPMAIALATQTRTETAVTLGLLSATVPTALQVLLAPVSDDPTEWLARKAVAQRQAGLDPSALQTLLLAKQNPDGGFGTDLGYASNPLDTAWALQALMGASTFDTAVNDGFNYLGQATISLGVYGINQQASVYITAQVGLAGSVWAARYTTSRLTQPILLALLAQRDPARRVYTDPFENAHALLALLPLTADRAVLDPLVSALRTAQASDGSWEQDPYVTAVALRALWAVSAAANPTTGDLQGVVLQAPTQTPLEGVTIQLLENSAFTTGTDTHGIFRLAGISPGRYTLHLSKVGYRSRDISVQITAGQIQDAGRLILEPQGLTAVLSGTIQSKTGQPLQNATVSAGASSVFTDAKGQYTLNNLSPGTATITVARSGYKTVTATLTLAAGQRYLFSPTLYPNNVTPPSTATLQGRVLDAATQKPLAGAQISLPGNSVAQSGADGRFSLANVAPGPFVLTIELPGYQSMTVSGAALVGLNALGDLPIKALPVNQTASLSGIVKNPNGQVLANATITVNMVSTRTDSQGNYALPSLPPGPATLSAALAGYVTATTTVTFEAGKHYLFSPTLYPSNITPPTTATLQGRVTDAATLQPIAGAQVNVSTATPVITGVDGRFKIDNLAPGALQLTVRATGYQEMQAAGSLVGGINTVGDLALQPIPASSTLTGVVLDGATQTPIVDASVSVQGTSTLVRTGTDGRYRLTGPAGAALTVAVSATGYITQTVTVTLPPAGGTLSQDIALVKPVTSAIMIQSASANQSSYSPHAEVKLAVKIVNGSAQAAALVVRGLVLDANGLVVHEIKANAVGLGQNPPNLPLTFDPGLEKELELEWLTIRQAAGDYRVVVQALDGLGRVVAEKSVPIQFEGMALLAGGVTPTPPLAQVGTQQAITLTADVVNTGNIPLPAGDLHVNVILDQPDTTTSTIPRISGKPLACDTPLNTPFGLLQKITSGALYTVNQKDRRLIAVATDGSMQAVAQLPSGCMMPNTLAIDATGDTWVGCGNQNFYRITSQGTITPYQTAELQSIKGIEVGENGVVYLGGLSSGEDRLVRFDGPGQETVLWRNGLSQPAGILKNSPGDYVVANTGDHTLSKVNPQTGVISTFVNNLNRPSGLTMDRAGNYYVANTGDNTIVRITPNGTKSVYATGLNQPFDLKFDAGGVLYVSNRGDSSLVRVLPNGQVQPFLSALAVRPVAVRYDAAGNLWILNEDGTLRKKETTGAVSVVATGISSPKGMTVTPSGEVLVTSYGSGMVQRVSGGTASPFLTDLSGPHSVAVGPDQRVYITEYSASRIKWFDIMGIQQGQSESLLNNASELRVDRNAVYAQSNDRLAVFEGGSGRLLHKGYFSAFAPDFIQGGVLMIIRNAIQHITRDGTVSPVKTLSFYPNLIAQTATGELILAGRGQTTFSKLDAGGHVAAFASVPKSSLARLISDSTGNIYYQLGDYSLYQLLPDGTSRAIPRATLSPIYGLSADAQGRLIATVYDQGYKTIAITPATGAVTNLLSIATNSPGATVDTSGLVYVLDGKHLRIYNNGTPSGLWSGFNNPGDLVTVSGELRFIDGSGDYYRLAPGSYPEFISRLPSPTALGTDGTRVYFTSSTGVYRVEADGKASLLKSLTAINTLSGIAIRPDGVLTVADTRSSRIITLSSSTPYTILEDYAGIDQPGGLAFDRQGQLLVSAYSANTVVRIDPKTGTSQFFATVSAPGFLTIDADDTVWVTRSGALSKVTAAGIVSTVFNNLWLDGVPITPSGVLVDSGKLVLANQNSSTLVAQAGTGWRTLAVGLRGLSTLRRGPDGALYIGSQTNRSVVRYQNGQLTPYARDFGIINALAFSPDGVLFVGQNSGGITQVSTDGIKTDLPVSGLFGSGVNITGVSAPSAERFFVATSASCITTITVTQAPPPPPAGTVVYQSQVPMAALANSDPYQHLALGSWLPDYGGDYRIEAWRPGYEQKLTNFVHIGPAANSQLLAMKDELPPGDQVLPMCMNLSGADFTSISRVELSGVRPVTSIAAPNGMTADKVGNIYFTNANTLYKTTPDGQTTTLASNENFRFGLAVDNDEYLYAPARNAKTGRYDLVRFDTQGHRQVVVDLGVTSANGVQVDSHGDILVGSPGKLLKSTPQGVLSVVTTAGLPNPRGLAIDGRDNVYIQNENHLVTMVRPDGSSSQIFWKADGKEHPIFEGDGYPNIAADCADNFYIATSMWEKIGQSGEEHTLAQVVPRTGRVALLFDALKIDPILNDIDYLAYDRFNSRVLMWNDYERMIWQVPVTCGAISVDVHLLTKPGQTLSALTKPTSAVAPLPDGRTEHVWSLKDVTVQGQQICFDASQRGLTLGELRKTLDSGYISFQNTFAPNTVKVPLAIPEIQVSSLVNLSLQTDKLVYGPAEVANLTATLQNTYTRSVSGTLTLEVFDAQNVRIAQVKQQALTLNRDETLPVSADFPINHLLPATYTVKAHFDDAAVELARASTDFKVKADSTATITTQLALDRARYQPTDQVHLYSRVLNPSTNAIYQNLTLRLTVLDAADQQVFETRHAIAQLIARAEQSFEAVQPLSNAPTGRYTVVQELLDANGAVLDRRQVTYEVASTADTGFGLEGAIVATPKVVRPGETVRLVATVANQGNAALPDVPLTVYVVDAEQGQVLGQFDQTLDLGAGATQALPPQDWKAQGRIGATLLAVLTAQVGGQALTLAQDSVQLAAPQAAGITATGGTPQHTPIDATYPTPLQATVRDTAGQPLAGITVTFAAPAQGASVNFPSGNTAVTNAQGQAEVAITANGTVGAFQIRATAPGVNDTAVFALENRPAITATITATGGTPQTGSPGQILAKPLQATVRDFNNQPLKGVVVSFSAPTQEPTVTFPDGQTAVTNAHGQASVRVKGGAQTGIVTVVATAPQAQGEARFMLTLEARCADPAPLRFTPLTDQPVNTWVTSNTVTLSGMGAGCTRTLSIVGGEYRLARGGRVITEVGRQRLAATPGYSIKPMAVQDGDQLTLAQTTSTQPATTTTVTVTLGGASRPGQPGRGG